MSSRETRQSHDPQDVRLDRRRDDFCKGAAGFPEARRVGTMHGSYIVRMVRRFGNVYVADTMNNVAADHFLGAVSTLAGSAGIAGQPRWIVRRSSL